MDALRMSIQAQTARLDMQGDNLRLSTSMPPASMDIVKEKGGMQIETRHPQIVIDASVAKSEEGHATVEELTRRFSQQGMQDLDTACRQINDLGQVFQKQMTSKNAIARYALNKAVPAMRMCNITFMPSTPPQISFTDNQYEYSYQPDSLQVSWNIHQSAAISVDVPAQLSIWLAQEPGLHFSVTA